MDYLKELNPQQRDAVVYTDGPQLVIAGAGSGKTRVLTYKIVHLLSHGVEPWRILALTFTNKAAREMLERVESVVGQKDASKIWMGTFHSIFLRILRTHADRLGFKNNFTIYDTSDSKSLIKAILRDMELDEKVYKPTTVMSAISWAKNALISPRQYAMNRDIMEADKRAQRPLIYKIYDIYMTRCKVAGAMDFDDLLYYTNILLRDNPDILHHYQEYFKYVLIDEYQDTNFAQHLIATQLCAVSQKLCVVGDDAQSIYSFRGANIRNILNLKNTYPTLQTFKLEQNYRSTQNIINVANSLIDKNTEQIRKHVFSKNALGAKVEVTDTYSDYEEAYVVASQISRMHMHAHDSYDDYAILYRTNNQSRRLEEALRNRNIPYRIWGGLAFYQRKEVKDAISYFRLIANPNDDEALRRIINVPARGIGETSMKKLVACAMEERTSIWNIISNPDKYPSVVGSAARKKIEAFRQKIANLIESTRLLNAEELAALILRDTGLMAMYISDSTPESVSKRENLQELLADVHDFVTERHEEGIAEISMTDYLSNISLATDQDTNDQTGECVTLMTVHASKGLEFKNVFIIGVEEELFPSAMASDSFEQIEEERRLLYVAITRAKEACMISYAKSRFRNGQTVPTRASRFLNDIDASYLHFSSGTSFADTKSTNPIGNYWARNKHISQTTNGLKQYNDLLNQSKKEIAAPAGNEDIHSAGQLKEGMKIRHSRFGEGSITSIVKSAAGDAIVVEFNSVGEKKLLLKFARFAIVSE
ncbi:MAG: UvrD-helicase domain-containing protein [Muribaculum sp.]|nr:UvrD-helicase domain-containing protein [Muribaculaceae bacterium]MCM1080879.1 UvrD-helicase domain-containing protein [Muribaculum sp.]